MSTRSRIAKQSPDGKVTMIYCHSDGYITRNGRILQEHYQDESKINQLLALGDISFLAPEIGTKHSFDNRPRYDSPEYEAFQNMVLAYHRDRGESRKETKARTWPSLAEIPTDWYEEFFYLRRDGKWFYSDHGNFTDLVELTAEVVRAEVEAEEKRMAEYRAKRSKAGVR
jgi:hypothetical protein